MKGYDDNLWVDVGQAVVERATYLKFSNHPGIDGYLRSTGKRELVEASPHDRRWGIGLDATKASL